MWKNKKKFIAAQVSDSETVSRKEIGNFDSFKKKITTDVSDRRNYAVSFDKIRNTLGFEAATLMEFDFVK